jgi:ribonucleoside-diphosphate reductase alpha chain
LTVNGYDEKEVQAYPEEKLEEVIKKSPYYKATSNDIDWLSKVSMQGAIQKWVDHSISVTVNVPKEATEDLVSKIYKTAWESGCKGMTIYRDGSRSGVLVTNDDGKEDENEFKETKAPTRPRVLEAEIVRFQNDYDKWIAVIGVLNQKPYEIFTGKADGFFIPPFVTKGYVIKNKLENQTTRYDFQFEDKEGYKVTIEALSRSFDKEYWNYAKLISGILRHGMPIPFVTQLIGNLTLDDESINTWKNGVIRALKKYIPDGTAMKKASCPECGDNDSLVYQDGCLTCNSCGYSKCG